MGIYILGVLFDSLRSTLLDHWEPMDFDGEYNALIGFNGVFNCLCFAQGCLRQPTCCFESYKNQVFDQTLT